MKAEGTPAENQKISDDISWTCNEEGGLGEFSTHRAHRRRMG